MPVTVARNHREPYNTTQAKYSGTSTRPNNPRKTLLSILAVRWLYFALCEKDGHAYYFVRV
jgi:hypothetical protein